jgi:hypothetical protein
MWSLPVSSHRHPACYVTQLVLLSWEFFTTLDYELKVFRGRLPYRWTIWVRNDRMISSVLSCPSAHLLLQQVYSLSRVAALLGVITSIVIMDVTTQINCQVGTVFHVFFSLGF